MGFQFAHIATFSRKGNGSSRSVVDICAEAARLPGHHPHVDCPLPPVLLAGNFGPQDVPAEIERRIAEAKRAAKGRSKVDRLIIRQDTHVLEAQVFSHPAYTRKAPLGHEGEDRPCLDDPETRRSYLKWRDLTVNFALADAKRRGLEVLSIVEHVDEEHPHIHVLAVPLNANLNAKSSHPGHAAASRRQQMAAERNLDRLAPADLPASIEPDVVEKSKRGKRRGADIGRNQVPMAKANRTTSEMTKAKIIKALGDRAYKAAMRGWQNDYYSQVALLAGLTRIGPGRRRLTRVEWRQSQQQAAAAAKLHDMVSKLEVSHSELSTQIEDRREHLTNAEAGVKDALNEIRRLEATAEINADAYARADAARQWATDDFEARRQKAEAKIAEAASIEDRMAILIETIAARETDLASLQAETLKKQAELEKLSAEAERKNHEAALLQATEASRLEQLGQIAAAITAAENKKVELLRSRGQLDQDISALSQKKQDLADENTVIMEDISARQAEIEKQETELAGQLAKARQSEKELNARMIGLDAWARRQIEIREGKLTYSAHCSVEERDTIQSASAWLLETLPLLAERIKKRMESALDVVVLTVKTWGQGKLYLTKTQDGSVRSVISGTEESQTAFRRGIRAWPRLSDRILQVLPAIESIGRPGGSAGVVSPAIGPKTDRDIDPVTAMIQQKRNSRGR